MTAPSLGFGIGWRASIAGLIEGIDDLGFVEVVAEALAAAGPIPGSLARLNARGVRVIPHGLRLSLGGADRPDPKRIAHLAGVAARLDAPVVSEHLAFVRARGAEAGHLMPVPRTWEAVKIVAENVRLTQQLLPVPLALEHIAALVEWPEAELNEAAFLTEILDRTGVLLLLDVANLYANARNHRYDPLDFLDRVPLDRIAYVHVAGGHERDGVYHDTHAHPVPRGVLELLEELYARTSPPGVLLERDDDFPPDGQIVSELQQIRAAAGTGTRQRNTAHDG
jgi:uncharacterized protein (UPF0276 family)